jgi:hypothetical protein
LYSVKIRSRSALGTCRFSLACPQASSGFIVLAFPEVKSLFGRIRAPAEGEGEAELPAGWASSATAVPPRTIRISDAIKAARNMGQLPSPEPIEQNRVFGKFQQESFLVEARSISGYSGSPVFLILHSAQSRQQEELRLHTDVFRLLGIQWGYIQDYEPVRGGFIGLFGYCREAVGKPCLLMYCSSARFFAATISSLLSRSDNFQAGTTPIIPVFSFTFSPVVTGSPFVLSRVSCERFGIGPARRRAGRLVVTLRVLKSLQNLEGLH